MGWVPPGHTSLSGHVRLKMEKNVTFAGQTLGTTDLRIGMHTQLNFWSNMGWFLPGHTSFNWCVWLKIDAKKEFRKLHIPK